MILRSRLHRSGLSPPRYPWRLELLSLSRVNGVTDPCKGKVVGIDHIPELVDWSKQNLKADGLGGKVDNEEIMMVCGDGRKGFAEQGLFLLALVCLF